MVNVILRLFLALMSTIAFSSFASCDGNGGSDTTPPRVISNYPPHNADEVALNTAIIVNFSEEIFPGTLHQGSVILYNSENKIDGTITYADKCLRFKPAELLAENTSYALALTPDVLDTAGNPIEQTWICKFTTGSQTDTTAPKIISATPSCDSSEVSLNTAIMALFSEYIDPLSLHATSFVISDSVEDIAGTVTCEGQSAVFTPDADLQYNTTYMVTISTEYTDLAGNPMASERTCSFTTGTELDMTPPQIISTMPACGATGISPNTFMSTTFSEAMDPSSLLKIPFVINDGTQDISGSVTYSGVSATFHPDEDLQYNTTYSATISTNPTDLAGNHLVSELTCSFSTGSETQLDTTAPEIVSTTPACGATDVSPNTSLSVTFSEAMDPSSLHVIPFVINDGTQDITGTVIYSGLTATFYPDEDLAYNTTYSATISTNPTDLSGNHLVSELTCSFSTGSQTDTTPPQIISTTPSCGAIDVSPDTTLTTTFSEPMDPASLLIIPFVINDGTQDIGGTVTYSGVTATFTPDESLQYDTTYTATISTNPTDLSGNHLESELTCSFTTGHRTK